MPLALFFERPRTNFLPGPLPLLPTRWALMFRTAEHCVPVCSLPQPLRMARGYRYFRRKFMGQVELARKFGVDGVWVGGCGFF